MRIGIAFAFLALAGCASEFNVYDANKTEIVGFPVATPVLVKITKKTNFKVIEGSEHVDFARYCTPQVSSTHGFLPLGEVVYVSFDPAELGKGEFALEFSDSGSLKKLSINSDASAGVDSVTGFLEKVLPFYKAPEAEAEATPGATSDDSEALRKKHCINQGTTVESIERLDIE